MSRRSTASLLREEKQPTQVPIQNPSSALAGLPFWIGWIVVCSVGELCALLLGGAIIGSFFLLGNGLVSSSVDRTDVNAAALLAQMIVGLVAGAVMGAVLAWFQSLVVKGYLHRMGRLVLATAIAGAVGGAAGLPLMRIDAVRGTGPGQSLFDLVHILTPVAYFGVLAAAQSFSLRHRLPNALWLWAPTNVLAVFLAARGAMWLESLLRPSHYQPFDFTPLIIPGVAFLLVMNWLPGAALLWLFRHLAVKVVSEQFA